MVGGGGRLRKSTGVEVERTKGGGTCWEREHEAFVLRARTSWGHGNTSVGGGILQRKGMRIEGINVSAELTIRKYSERESRWSSQESALLFSTLCI